MKEYLNNVSQTEISSVQVRCVSTCTVSHISPEGFSTLLNVTEGMKFAQVMVKQL